MEDTQPAGATPGSFGSFKQDLLLAEPAFREGKVHTQFVENEFLPTYGS